MSPAEVRVSSAEVRASASVRGLIVAALSVAMLTVVLAIAAKF